MIKINRELMEDSVMLYGPNDQYLGKIYTILEFLDVRRQIMENQVEGYYVVTKSRERIEFTKEGRLERPCKGLFDMTSTMLMQLAFPRKK